MFNAIFNDSGFHSSTNNPHRNYLYMKNFKAGDYFSFDNGKAFGLTFETGWFLVIHILDEHDDEPRGSYLIETWKVVPENAKSVNTHTENFGGMGINIALAFEAAKAILMPSEQAKMYLRPASTTSS